MPAPEPQAEPLPTLAEIAARLRDEADILLAEAQRIENRGHHDLARKPRSGAAWHEAAARMLDDLAGQVWRPISTAPRDRRIVVCDQYGMMWLSRWGSLTRDPVGWELLDFGGEPVLWFDLPSPSAALAAPPAEEPR